MPKPPRSTRLLRRSLTRVLPFALSALCATSPLHAQVAAKPDGKMRAVVGLAATVVSGNTRSSSVSANAEGIQLTDYSKWMLIGRSLYAENDEGTTAASLALGTQYDRDLNPDYFAFGKLDYLRDKPANIQSRGSVYSGLGRHLIRNDRHNWDAIVGVGYTEDRYVEPTIVSDQTRTRYGRAEMLFSESSNHKLTANTTFRQKVEIYPGLSDRGDFRAVLDTGLAVAMTSTLSLTTGLIYRHNSDPGTGIKKGDTTFVTGIAYQLR